MSKLPEPVQEQYPHAKFVASVQVFIDTEFQGSSGALSRIGGESYIVLAPNGIDQIKTKKHLFTVLAHELGHWISAQQESPAATDKRAKFMHMVTGDGRFVLPAEREAWDWAEKILPDLEQEHRREALRTYGDTLQHARLI